MKHAELLPWSTGFDSTEKQALSKSPEPHLQNNPVHGKETGQKETKGQLHQKPNPEAVVHQYSVCPLSPQPNLVRDILPMLAILDCFLSAIVQHARMQENTSDP